MRVGCDGKHTLLCGGCEYATDRGWQCELPVNQGGTTEKYIRPYLKMIGAFFIVRIYTHWGVPGCKPLAVRAGNRPVKECKRRIRCR